MAKDGFNHLTMSVNVSPHQLNDTRFVGYVVTALQSTGIEASSLEIEITERMFWPLMILIYKHSIACQILVCA